MNQVTSRIAFSLALVSMPMLTTVSAQAPAPKAAPNPTASSATFMPGAEMKWKDEPDFPGVKMAVLEGDPTQGPSHFFLRLPAGFSAGMHFHNADHWVAVISGTMLLTPEGGAEKSLSAGSGFAFTGMKKHTTLCAKGADCLLFVDARAKWDVVPVAK